ncbi:aspartate carbamoyltransferase catalytic subunit [Thermosulfurimonas sp. F29]|uniref:aspartate carbamoyltransferase catalytic subunit n=1 Tax=Thermosulfurimonas sp. F29 TaxID=2867247 RepID=UPI001C83BA6F|nr:aspartate carbamoyltransferase catalytic subunit [Thermosulfurimonas sp. F29]MBX6423997.1 aspartate carbamoyltransferase catalytic subunit [Thermosulfurimonas sp. F29]
MGIEFPHRHLLEIGPLSREDIRIVLETARNLKEVLRRPIPKVPTLRGKVVANLFFEPSTRTKLSFERAAKVLSAEVLNFSARGSSLEKGENLLDTVKNLKAMGPDLFVIRHPASGAPHFVARHIDVPVINAGDGFHEHPTQALLDLLTVWEKKGTLSGLKVAIIGDIRHSRVAHSDILAFRKMGAEVCVSGPGTLLPPEREALGARVCFRPEEAVEGADVVIALRVQKERHGRPLFPSFHEYARYFGLSREILSRAAEGALLMHPGPINWGIELAPELADFPGQVILEQVENGVAVRMALLLLLLKSSEGSA